MIGIYKITSPSKKIYIGQSRNIIRRFKNYKDLNCKGQKRLYHSFLKHGVEKHLFEIECECDESELNDKERYYQDLYSAIGKKGLNCSLTKSTDRNGRHSDDTRKKISLKNKGRVFTEEFKKKLSIAHTGKVMSEETKRKMSLVKLGYTHSEESKKKMMGRVFSEETRKKLSITGSRRTHSDETRLKISVVQSGKVASEETKRKMSKSRKGHTYGNGKSRIILNTETGIFYFRVAECALLINMKTTTLQKWLSGQFKNKSPFIFV